MARTSEPSLRSGRTIGAYKSYNFVDKDPVIDLMRDMVRESGQTHKEIHEQSGVSISTIYNWFDGPTKRPQFATVAAVVATLGYTLTLRQGAPNNSGSAKAHMQLIRRRIKL